MKSSLKSNAKDMGYLLRFTEREVVAGNFLTRINNLPPLNFNCERQVLVIVDGTNRYWN
jgi:hypothetical protein